MEPEIAWMQNEQEANANAGQQDGDGDGEGGGAGPGRARPEPQEGYQEVEDRGRLRAFVMAKRAPSSAPGKLSEFTRKLLDELAIDYRDALEVLEDGAVQGTNSGHASRGFNTSLHFTSPGCN